MKKIKYKIRIKVLGIITMFMIIIPGCEPENDIYSIYTPDTFYQTDFQILSSLSGVYRNYAAIPTFGQPYRIMELCTDQVVVHGKIQGWWANSDFEQLAEHKWDEQHGYFNGVWNTLFKTVGQANALLSSLESSPLESATNAKAELKALRAYAYFYLMDLFGNVPIFTLPKVDPLDLPKQNTRAEVFNFVVSQLKEAQSDLPSQNDVGSEYYGRLTREAVYGILATVYLNAEVYTGTAKNDSALIYANKVVDSKAFSLLPDYFDNFVYNNEGNAEFIFGGVYSPDQAGGIGHPIVQKVMPGISGGLFGLPYTPQDGFGTRPSVVAQYEASDVRRKMFMLPGVLLDPRNGDTVFVERIVPDGNSVLYEPGKSTEGPVPYEIINATGIRLQPMNAGIKWLKWGLDPNTNGGNAGNDIAFIRYADILLIKAEALMRQDMANEPEAKAIINEIRARSNASEITATLTLDDIFNERGRELCFEMKRRTDLIRFDKFGDPWEFKEASEDFRKLFPIPKAARDANPNLRQNPGYN
jgi:starch-binding outer membrane protein, SusD/RagB family